MMFGDGSFGELAFGEFPEYTPPGGNAAFEAFLADIEAPRCWLLEIDAFSLAAGGGITSAFGDAGFGELSFGGDAGAFDAPSVTLRYSSHGYSTRNSDTPASTWYDGRLTDQIRVERRISGRDGIGGLSSVFAEVEVINSDGELDELTRNFAIDGRPARLYLGRPTDARADFGQVFGGIVQSVSGDLASLKLALSDASARLAVPIQRTLYAGTGGLEGGADLKGKPKPKCYGQVHNITPPLVDSPNLIYQVHDGLIDDVTAVYDRGIALTQVVGAPAGGEYQVAAATGTFKLGAAPAGTVTADVKGDASLSGYTDQINVILLRILLQQALLTDGDIDPSSFANLNTDAPAALGIWIGTEARSVADVVDELLTSVGAFGGFSRVGAIRVGVIKAPGAPVAATYTEEDIFTIERLPLPPALEPLAWRVSVAYQKNYTVQTDLAAAVPAARQDFVTQPMRLSTRADEALLSRRWLARDYGPVPGLYVNQTDADDEATRLYDLWSTPRQLLRVPVPATALSRDIGDNVTLTHRRHGLQGGVSVRVLGHAINARNCQVELLVLA